MISGTGVRIQAAVTIIYPPAHEDGSAAGISCSQDAQSQSLMASGSGAFVMDPLQALRDLPGTSVQEVAFPTFKLFASLLKTRAAEIRSVQCDSYSYGPDDRQRLDLYSPASPCLTNGRRTVLIFLYGGGFVNGNRTLPLPFLDGLVHANIGAFFALKHGYTVVIPDYRLLSHGAIFPSGGEDVALTVDWIRESREKVFGNELLDLFILGNSAGGVHLATYLFHRSFAEFRAKVSAAQEGPTSLQGVIFLSVPYTFDYMEAQEKQVPSRYLANRSDVEDDEGIKTNCPLGLMAAALSGGPDGECVSELLERGKTVLVLTCELDPEDLCLKPQKSLLQFCVENSNRDIKQLIHVDSIAGHNHVSPCLSLMSGNEEAEAWGFKIVSFCEEAKNKSAVSKAAHILTLCD